MRQFIEHVCMRVCGGCRGRVLPATSTLAAAGVGEGDVITVVRIELVAEGWKVSVTLKYIEKLTAVVLHGCCSAPSGPLLLWVWRYCPSGLVMPACLVNTRHCPCALISQSCVNSCWGRTPGGWM